MNNNRNWESFVWIIIGVFILSIVILGIWNMIVYSKEVVTIYKNNSKLSILKNNLSNVLKYIDISWVNQNELFYIYKNETTNTHEVFTWSTNYLYKYIDEYWNKVDDLVNYEWNIYARILWLERTDVSLWQENHVVRASIRKLIKR